MPDAHPNPYESPLAPTTREEEPSSTSDLAQGDAGWLGFCGASFGGSAGAAYCGGGAIVGSLLQSVWLYVTDPTISNSVPFGALFLLPMSLVFGLFGALVGGMLFYCMGFIEGMLLAGQTRADDRLKLTAGGVAAVVVFCVTLALQLYGALVPLSELTSRSQGLRPHEALQEILLRIATGPLFLLAMTLAAFFAGRRWAEQMIAEAWPDPSELR